MLWRFLICLTIKSLPFLYCMLMLCLSCFHRYRDSQRAQREEVLSYARVSKPPRSEQESDSGVCQGTLLWVSPHFTACVKCIKVNEFSQNGEVTNQVVYFFFFLNCMLVTIWPSDTSTSTWTSVCSSSSLGGTNSPTKEPTSSWRL